MANTNRPLSPHLQIYRWEITMFSSILHRATGVALALGAVMMTAWLYALFMTGATLTAFYTFAKSPFGVLVCFGFLFALCYHLLNGIRYLIFSTGYGITRRGGKISGWATLIATFILTVVVWNHARGVYATVTPVAAAPAQQEAPAPVQESAE